MTDHRCREGEAIGMEWKPYPYITTYCGFCKAKMSEIPLDDAPDHLSMIIENIILFMKRREE